MNMKNLIPSMKFFFKRHSPTIKLVGGIGATLGGTALACMATVKAVRASDIYKEELKNIEAMVVGDDDKSKARRVLKFETGKKIILAYLPALAVEGLGIAGIVSSHKELKGIGASAALAAAGLNRSMKELKEKLKEKLGEEEVEKLFSSIGETEEVKVTETDISEPCESVVKRVNTSKNVYGPFAALFDELNPNYVRRPGANRNWLSIVQNVANRMLDERGYVFLNEVFDLLGLPRTKEGNIYGWTKKKGNPTFHGDGYISFGYEDDGPFMRGEDNSVLLSFNVDEMPILDIFEDLM